MRCSCSAAGCSRRRLLLQTLTLPAKPPAGDTAYIGKICSLMYFITSIYAFAIRLKWHGLGERKREVVFTGEFLLAWMYWVEMGNVFALLSDEHKLAKAQCHCQRIEELITTGALISGLEINMRTYVHTHIHVYTCIYVL